MPVLSTFASLPGAAPNLPIQLPRDFTAIGFAAENPMFIVVNPSLGIKKLSDLIARAKGHPDEISRAVTGIGRLTHLTVELFKTGRRAMSPAEAITFVQAEQRKWKPVLELIANKTN